jgi:hypothetical protein
MADLGGGPAVKDIVLPPVVVFKSIREITAQDVVVAAFLSRHV